MASEFKVTDHLQLTGFVDNGASLTWQGELVSFEDGKVVDVNSNGILDIGVDYFGRPELVFTGYVIIVNDVSYATFGNNNSFFVPYDSSFDDLAAVRPLDPQGTSINQDTLPILYLSLFSSDDDDPITGTSGPDVVDAGVGNDEVSGGLGNDVINGGIGDDTLLGQAGNDTLDGNIGDDSLDGGADNDSLEGGDGKDTLDGSGGQDTLKGEKGDDLLIFRASQDNDIFDGGEDTDTFRIIPNVSGTQDLTQSTFANLEIYEGRGQSVIINPGQLDQFTLIRDIGTVFHPTGGRSDLSNAVAPGEAGRFQGQGTQAEAFDDYFDISGADTGWEMDGWFGNDTLIGGEGNDTLSGRNGQDTLIGNGGNDVLESAGFGDRLEGGLGDDTFRVVENGNVLNPNNDTMIGSDGTDTILNNTFSSLQLNGLTIEGVETLDSSNTRAAPGQLEQFANIENFYQLIHVSGGETNLNGINFTFQRDNVVFNGSEEDDILRADTFTTPWQINGSRGNDQYYLGAGADTVISGGGNDIIETGAGHDTIDGREGNDTIRGQAGDDTIQGNDGNDLIEGGSGNDSLDGFRGNDTLRGNEDDDILDGRTNDDLYDGGSGTDTAVIRQPLANATVSVTRQWIEIQSSQGQDTVLPSVENIQFTDQTVAYGDLYDSALNRINGDPENNSLRGTDTRDVIDGLAGNDTIIGLNGDDDLTGGPDNDLIFGDGAAAAYFGTTAANQVYRLYQATLDRAPDITGHYNWTSRIATGERSIEEVAAGFVGSPEFTSRFPASSNTDFVTLLYNNVLGNDPDDRGLARWVGELESGSSRAQVVLGFSDSPQFTNETATMATRYAMDSLTTTWSDDVFRLYQATLDRAPDEQGLNRWTGELAEGTSTLEQVSAGFVGSPEFTSRFPASSNTDFVTLLYNNVLNSAPDTGGLNRWVGDLEGGASRAEVVLGFSQSPQFTAQTAPDVKQWMRDQGTDDRIDAGAGVNLVAGGQYADVFVFNAGETGATTVADLEPWDQIELVGFGYATAAEARAEMAQTADNLVFNDQGVQVTFRDTTLADITDDMIIV